MWQGRTFKLHIIIVHVFSCFWVFTSSTLKGTLEFFPTSARELTDSQDGPGPWSLSQSPAVGPHRTRGIHEQGGTREGGAGFLAPARPSACFCADSPTQAKLRPAASAPHSPEGRQECSSSTETPLNEDERSQCHPNTEPFWGKGKKGNPPPTGVPLTREQVLLPHVAFRAEGGRESTANQPLHVLIK